MTKWLQIGQSLAPQVLETIDKVLGTSTLPNPDLANAPRLALYHLNACLNASIEQNRASQPAVAMALLRQCVEALTVIEAGLQSERISGQLLAQWCDGKLTTGGLRKELSTNAWPSYGPGLWTESWHEFFGNLAASVHPYAHYSPDLQQWQLAVVAYDGQSRTIVMTGAQTADPVKASRVTLLHSLLIWTLARILAATYPKHVGDEMRCAIHELGASLASSKLLFRACDWATQLLPHVMFRPGVDWLDS